MRIGIIGAGFSGTAIAANLCQHPHPPSEITLFDKSGVFGAGPAYSTPYPYHLLNVRAQDMSAFAHDPLHFVNWLMQYPHKDTYSEPDLALAQQFVPRKLFGEYLQHLLQTMQASGQACQVNKAVAEIIDILPEGSKFRLMRADGQTQLVDKVIFSLGNNPAASFPFPVAAETRTLADPWDYRAVESIPAQDPVLIVGTGLSMIDAVLTLHHHGHAAKIHVLSRHGLLPLPHKHLKADVALNINDLPTRLLPLTKHIRTLCMNHVETGGDWREIIQAFRLHLPAIWQRANNADKLRFLRHVLPYWNVHRHRVHSTIMELLTQMQEQQQLQILCGRVLGVGDGKALIQTRHSQQQIEIPCRTLINCMGPTQPFRPAQQPLIRVLLDRDLATLDALQLGFAVTASGAMLNSQGVASSALYTVGAPTKGAMWEISAVPEIRKQVTALVQQLLA